MGEHNEFHPGAFRRGLRHADLTDGEFRVAVEMAEHANVGKPIVWPGAMKLAETCGKTRNGIQGVLKRLEAKGVIMRADSASNKGGRGHANRWRLLVVPEPERANGGYPFGDAQRANGRWPLAPERANDGTAKGPTTERERANGGWPEVVRSSSEVGGARASEPTDQSGNGSRRPTTPENSSLKDHAPEGAADDSEALSDWAIPPDPCPKGGNCEKSCRHCAAGRMWNTKEAKAERQDANYTQAHRRFNVLLREASTGMYGDWRPTKPPLNRSGFDPNIPWLQPIPPPEADGSVNGYEQW